MSVRTHVWISGRVQGVWFRDSCARRAREEGVAGWCRNLVDGRVEAVFEGPPGPVEGMVAWCHEGPPRAHVTDVERRGEEPVGEVDFRVR